MIRTRFIRRHFIEKAVREFRPTGKVLEVGSGKEWRYYPGSVTLNRDAAAEPDVICDAENMKFDDSHFDAVVCLEVIEHTPSPHRLISEIRRVMKPGGPLLLTVPFVFEIHEKYDYARFTKQGLSHLFKEFSSVTIRPNGGKYCVIFHFLRLGTVGSVLFPLLNNLGYLLDLILESKDPRITLGYTVVAIK